jgi:hypothetical protein
LAFIGDKEKLASDFHLEGRRGYKGGTKGCGEWLGLTPKNEFLAASSEVAEKLPNCENEGRMSVE